jgi:hypothetical protein
MTKKIALVALVLGLLAAVLSPGMVAVYAQDQGQITVTGSNAQMNFPLALSFSAQVKSNTNITDIRLRYQVEQTSFAQITSEGYVSFSPASSVNAKYVLDMRRVGGLPPGTKIEYWWAVKDAGGASLETQPVKFEITDNRSQWNTLTEGKVNLYWYQGSNSFAQSLMKTAQEAITKLASDTGATPDNMINIYIYASSSDLQGSMIYPNEWTGGVAFVQYSIIAIGISPSNLTWGQGAMTHELTHNVIFQVTANPYNDLPVWLNEGLAMYAEGPLTTQFTNPLSDAIRSNDLFSVRTLSSPFSAYADKANLSYAESETIVEYLIKQYGSTKMNELLKTFQAGSTYDGAFLKVYGFDMDGLNTQWQNWVKTQYGR